jgi:N-acyl-D-aspartate/D-glutamate deacylase
MRYVLMALMAACSLLGQPYDVVLMKGRAMDPETNLDAVRDIAISGNRIAAISASPLRGRVEIDAAGMVVAPGFVDLHQHSQTPEAYRYKAMDGVTTALELEVGVSPVSEWYAAREGKALINFGATSGHIPALKAIMHEAYDGLVPRDAGVNRAPTAEEGRAILNSVRQGLDQGALGIGIGLAYTPKVPRGQVLELFELAAQRHVPVYVHVRSGGPVEPGGIAALQEVLADVLLSGAQLHVAHITTTGRQETRTVLKMIEEARNRGFDVTTEAYPYSAAATDIASEALADGWQARAGIDYGDLQWAATGERLTADTFARYRKQGGIVVMHMIPEEMARLAVADPTVMIASDGIIENGKGHPRAAGTYARVLGQYVREQQALSLMEALRKMSLLPAQRLAIHSKGRLQVGSDADIAVFDPKRVIDRATYDNPAQYSEGIQYVLVGGVFVVRDGKLVDGVAPGRGIRR